MNHLHRLFLIVLLLTVTLVGCVPMIYGVPEARWEHMSEAEHATARETYTNRQRQQELERAEHARREAEIFEASRRDAEDKARRDRQQVEAVHRGESGVYGDLIRITISGGTMEFYGKRIPYEPITFTLANQERRVVSLRSVGGRAYRTLDVPVSYVDGTFTFDVGRNPIRLLQSPQWKHGEQYKGLVTGKNSKSDGHDLTVRVEIVPQAGVVIVGPRGSSAVPVSAPPAAPTGSRAPKIIRVETDGLYPDSFKRSTSTNRCINMSPFEEHLKAPIALKSYTIERKGITVLVDIIEVKTHDATRRRKICHRNGSGCLDTSDWMALKVNGTVMFLHTKEVKRIDFEDGDTMLFSALVINDRHAKTSSVLCWN